LSREEGKLDKKRRVLSREEGERMSREED